jgi:membrane-bound lytic murein transglycosylase D
MWGGSRGRGASGALAVVLMMGALLVLSGCAAGRQAASPRAEVADAGAGSLSEPDTAATDSEAAQLVAEALEATESARVFWQEGDTEAALETLDLAYELLLQIPDDADMTRQKEDLRHLISRRVVEIYRSRLTTASDLSSPIPLDMNEHVERELARFRGPERKFFLESYRRSGQYRPMIVRKLREAGLPEELSWLPLVESGFKTRALSSARALGMWQFISSTGSRYGLQRSHWIDERMDPEKSTDAAIGYLTDLHGMFGDWMTALAGYNCGEHRVMKVIRRQENDYLDHFWDVFGHLPRETARYVPRFLATLAIVRDPEKYGIELPKPLPPVRTEGVPIARHAQLADLDRALGLEKGTLAGLNPELRRGTAPATSYSLRVPRAVAPSFETKLAALPAYLPPPEETFARHRVRRGETLSTIARRYRTTVGAIARANNLRSRHQIRVGQRLKIPQRGRATTRVRASPAKASASWRHTVRRGDSLWKLASRYGTTVDRIKRENGLRSNQLAIGQRLKIETGPATGARRYTVRRGDTIGRIAKRHDVSVDAMLRANGLSRRSTIHPGQVLRLPQ